MNALIPAVPETLYHYTCIDHGHPGIYGTRELRPGGSGFIWLTDLEHVDRDALGLTRVSMTCDRGEVRYRVDVTEEMEIVSWMVARKFFEPTMVEDLERFPGALPRHWFITPLRTPAVHDPITKEQS